MLYMRRQKMEAKLWEKKVKQDHKKEGETEHDREKYPKEVKMSAGAVMKRWKGRLKKNNGGRGRKRKPLGEQPYRTPKKGKGSFKFASGKRVVAITVRWMWESCQSHTLGNEIFEGSDRVRDFSGKRRKA